MRCTLSIIFILLMPLFSWAVEEQSHIVEYDVRFSSILIAQAIFKTSTLEKHYRISASIKAIGLFNMISSLSARMNVEGDVIGDQLHSTSYILSYIYKKKKRFFEVKYQNDFVKTYQVIPKKTLFLNDWIKLSENDLLKVIDPISGLLAFKEDQLCLKKQFIFDGEMRYDLDFLFHGKKNFVTENFSGEAFVCSLNFIPKSGYRKDHYSIKHLQKSNIEVWFARSPVTHLYAPVYASIPVNIGTITIIARKY
ncbi:hypothetical protein B488_11280 [Liberibacter crescens BT-1]|uniref:DUF3108 domain-containing protein n=1 Tax=Liberibacter crescens (strain BT-1) TaxID=1215343 RepID=L0EWA3_LIBCB|nr:DUF3108 domain-containing protein [Liberibacter crescens]AGA65120.1 hypothetical protein B488_11280 [Liberibacter crescens BT-1]